LLSSSAEITVEARPQIYKNAGGEMTEFRKADASRRQFIKIVSAATSAAAVAQSPLAWGGTANKLLPYAPKTLTEAELATLKAVMARLIPADASSGGAVEARAYAYIDIALASTYSAQLPAYRQGLAALLALAKAGGAASAAALAAKDMDALLTRLEAGGVSEAIQGDAQQNLSFADGGKSFFAMLRQHTVEGTFSDPMYGGNQSFVGWRIVGYTGVQYFYTKAALSINGKAKYTNHSIAEFGGKPLL
jgi:gluconate 2-dehydrogenase gamma chain